MANLVLVGLNHRTAEVEIRERAAFDTQRLPDALKAMAARPGIREAMIISTCNRVELISLAENHDIGIQSLEQFLSENGGMPPQELRNKLYHYTGEQVVRHVFRVASSLDSMVLGEPQILGQIKDFYNLAQAAQTAGAYLNSLLQAAFRTAKRVRSETNIGEYSVSISSAAVELARKIFGTLHRKRILIVGAGKMGEIAIRHLVSSGAGSIRVTNRSAEAARELASRFHGTAIPFAELKSVIADSDIIITSTGAQETLIDRTMIQSIMHERKNAPIVFIDISVPRNVDSAVATIDNVFCYDIDDLGAVVEANIQERRHAAAEAEQIIAQESELFAAKLKSLDMTPLAIQIQDRIDQICRSELQRYLKRTGTNGVKEAQELESMMARIASKIAHPMLTQLKNAPPEPLHQNAYVEMIKKMFSLNQDDDGSSSSR